MLHIEENKLKLFLLNRKSKIENPKYSGIGEIISSISLIVTLSLADFNQVTIINSLYFQIVVWIISITLLLFGIYIFIKSLINYYSVDNLFKEIVNLDTNIEHSFDIIILKNSDTSGKYLLFKSKRWKCWLFPNYRCSSMPFNETEEVSYIEKCIKRDLKISTNVSIQYLGNDISNKNSVPNNVEKKYNFHYFVVANYNFIFNDKKKFRFNGKKYCWKTLDSMYSNKNIIKKNKDVLDYIREKCEVC